MITSKLPLATQPAIDPPSNTGSNSQTVSTSDTKRVGDEVADSLFVHVDWLAGTIRYSTDKTRDECIEFIEGYIGEKFHIEPGLPWHCGIPFAHSGRTISGARIAWNDPEGDADLLGHLYISLPGSLLSQVDGRNTWCMSVGLYNVWRFKPTRIDIALDDYAKMISHTQVAAAIKAGNVAKFDPKKTILTVNLGEDGFSLYMGSASSDRRACLYNKAAESEGELDCHRLEARYRDELAVSVFKNWISIESGQYEALSASYLAGCVVGAIDFPNRTSNPEEKNLSRLPKLDWWQAFLDRVGSIVTHSRPRVVRSLDRTKKWIENQVLRSLVVVREIEGAPAYHSWMREKMHQAKKNLSSWQEHLIREQKVVTTGVFGEVACCLGSG